MAVTRRHPVILIGKLAMLGASVASLAAAFRRAVPTDRGPK
jgi:hypothetical protein